MSDKNSPHRRAVAYLRTSTADKGQNPKRQLDLIQEWAARNDVDLVAHRADEGTSGAKNPLQRPAFRETIEVALEKEAEAIVVETVDRFTREGVKMFGWACIEVERNHDLALWLADAPLNMQLELGGMVVAAVQTEMARAWLERHRSAVTSGMRRAMAEGRKMGRPPKPFTDREGQRILELRAEGLSWGRIALRINEERGVNDLVDARARKRRSTSGGSVQREWERLQEPPKVQPSRSLRDLEGGGAAA